MAENSVRLDKWLWFARVVKTRTSAQKLVRSGKIRVNKLKVDNPAKSVGIDDVLTITLERQIFVLKIVECGIRRGPFVEAQGLYEDLSPAISPPSSEGVRGGKIQDEKVPRPDKQNRRKLLELKNRQYFQ